MSSSVVLMLAGHGLFVCRCRSVEARVPASSLPPYMQGLMQPGAHLYLLLAETQTQHVPAGNEHHARRFILSELGSYCQALPRLPAWGYPSYARRLIYSWWESILSALSSTVPLWYTNQHVHAGITAVFSTMSSGLFSAEIACSRPEGDQFCSQEDALVRFCAFLSPRIEHSLPLVGSDHLWRRLFVK